MTRKSASASSTCPAFYQDVEAQNAGDKEFRSTTRDVRRLINELKAEKIDGLVLDLRGNGGGYLPEATALTGLFIDKGPVVQLKVTTGELEVQDDPEPGVAYAGPLAVLVDRFSASASEIFAGAIQDYHRGTILGQRTFGKGTVQNLVPLDRWSPRPVNGQLTVTIGKFYRVTGESTQHRGVEPDVTLPSQIDMEEFGESALEGALPWDRIPGVPFRSEGKAQQPNIAVLATEEKTRADKRSGLSLAGRRPRRRRCACASRPRCRSTCSSARPSASASRSERLTRENARRAAQNLPALKTAEELADAKFPDTGARPGRRSHDRHGHRRRARLTRRPSRTVRSETKSRPTESLRDRQSLRADMVL